MVGSLVIHTEGEFRASSPRAIGRLACGPHGARRKGNPSVEPPSDRSARLWPSWSTPEGKPERRAPERSFGSLVALMEHAGRETRASSPRAIGRLACGSYGARRSMGDFYPIFEYVDCRMVTCKKGEHYAGLVLAERYRRLINVRPVLPATLMGYIFVCSSRSLDMAIEASFRSHGANQSQASLRNRT